VQLVAQKITGIDVALLEATMAPILRSHRVAAADVSFQKESQGWVLRVTVSALEPPARAPIDVGLLAEISRDVSTALDVADFIHRAYHLEVSSAGLDRPLRTPEDFRAAVGETVKVFLARPAADGQRVLRGQLASADDRSVTIEVDGNAVQADFESIEKAHTIFELPVGRPKGRPKAGKHKRH
jgi:ribosome maturation factor RimP